MSVPHTPSYCFPRLKVTLAVWLDGVEVAELLEVDVSCGTGRSLAEDGLLALF